MRSEGKKQDGKAESGQAECQKRGKQVGKTRENEINGKEVKRSEESKGAERIIIKERECVKMDYFLVCTAKVNTALSLCGSQRVA